MKLENIPKAKEDGREIAKILAYLKKQGFVFEGEKKGYLKCLLSMCRTPTERAR